MTDSKAIELARSAVLEVAGPDEVGELLAETATETGALVTFVSTHPGYVGWHWAAALSGDPKVVDEVWMEPGEGAIVAKPWQPWSERVQPGDLGPGDVLPTAPDDPRLMPGYTAIVEEELVEPLSPEQWSVGLGRERVLSPQGVDEAVYRWREGDSGPRTAVARYAEDHCSTCGWLLTIGGRLGQAFGVCANELSPSDGRIVSMDHGCGAHSQTVVEPGVVPVTELALDEFAYDLVDRNDLPEPEPVVETATEAVEVEPDEAVASEESTPSEESAATDES